MSGHKWLGITFWRYFFQRNLNKETYCISIIFFKLTCDSNSTRASTWQRQAGTVAWSAISADLNPIDFMCGVIWKYEVYNTPVQSEGKNDGSVYKHNIKLTYQSHRKINADRSLRRGERRPFWTKSRLKLVMFLCLNWLWL